MFKLVTEEELKEMVLITGIINRPCKGCVSLTELYCGTVDNKYFMLCKKCFIAKFGINPEVKK